MTVNTKTIDYMAEKERLTFDQLPDVIESLTQEISNLKQEVSVLSEHCMALRVQDAKAYDNNQILTTMEACNLLKCSKHTLYRWVSDGYVPCMKNGGKLTFVRDEILEWHRSGRKNEGESREQRERRYASIGKESGLNYL